MKKYGTAEDQKVIQDEESLAKTATVDSTWTQEDQEALRKENDDRDADRKD